MCPHIWYHEIKSAIVQNKVITIINLVHNVSLRQFEIQVEESKYCIKIDLSLTPVLKKSNMC